MEIPQHWRHSLFRYETFIDFLSLVFRHEERETHNFYYADRSIWPNQTRGDSPLDWHHPETNLNYFVQRQVSTNCFFFQKSPKFSAHRFRAWRHSHPQAHFLSGGFIMTFVNVTSSTREREHLHSMCAPERVLSRKFPSLTKPIDKI